MDEKKDYWEIYDSIESSIKFADTKAIAFIGIIGILLNFFQKQLMEVLTLPATNSLKILCIISIFSLISSLILSILCLYPRKSDETDKNAFYYKSIAKNFSEKEYCKYLHEIPNKTFNEQLNVQIYQLATVCDEKYKYVKYSLRLFIIGIGLLILLLILLYFNISTDVINLKIA